MNHFQVPELVPVNIAYGVACVIVAFTVIAKMSRGPNLDAIPTIGSSGWLASWWAGFKYLTNAQDIVQQGYNKYKSAPFKVAELNRWTVILSNRTHVDELAKASNEEFSFADALNDQIQIKHTLGSAVTQRLYHVTVIRTQLTRNIEALYPEIRDEIVTSFAEVLDLRENEWKHVPVVNLARKVVCRTSNRAFIGLPLCRNPDWIDLVIQFTTEIITGGIMIGLFPEFMRPLAVRLFTRVPQCIARSVKLLGPIIEERLEHLNEFGALWSDKPNDLLSWLMDESKGPDLSTENLTRRVLASNFAAVHTSANVFTQILLYLTANPQYIQPLREEVESIVQKDGWSKAALGKMRKIDSFFKECQRIEGMLIASLVRKAMKDFTFSDGTFIPKGTVVAVAVLSLHHDKNFYENPDTFEPFRFARMDDEDTKGTRHHFTSTSPEYLAFSHGRHACPGRFFAATELKLMLAHIVVTYDMKLEENETYPASRHMSTFIGPNPHARIMFRNRVD